jgi:hypothetical protein
VAAVLILVVIVVAFWAWSFYENSQPLDMAAIAQTATVRSADQAVMARIDADASALARGAPWLVPQDRGVADSCKPAYSDDNISLFSASGEQWQCTQQVVLAFGVTGNMRARSTALAADLTGDGWAAGPVQSVEPGFYLQWTNLGTGQVRKGNLGAGPASAGGFDLTVFWAERPAVLTIPLDKPLPAPAGLLNSAIRRAYARYAQVVILFYTGTYAAGTGGNVTSTPTPPPTPGPGPCGPGGGTNC